MNTNKMNGIAMIRYLTMAPRIGVVRPIRTNKLRVKKTERISKGFFFFCLEGKTKIRAMDNINTIFSRAAEKTGIESASQRNGRRSTVNIAIGICWTRENSVKGSVGSPIWCIALPVIAISANAFRFISKIAMKSKFGEIYFARMSKVPKHT